MFAFVNARAHVEMSKRVSLFKNGFNFRRRQDERTMRVNNWYNRAHLVINSTEEDMFIMCKLKHTWMRACMRAYVWYRFCMIKCRYKWCSICYWMRIRKNQPDLYLFSSFFLSLCHSRILHAYNTLALCVCKYCVQGMCAVCICLKRLKDNSYGDFYVSPLSIVFF